MDCSLLGSLIRGIFQARILEWVANFFSRGSSWSRDWTHVSSIAERRFTIWVTREVRKKRELGVNSLTNCMALHEFPTQTGYVGTLSRGFHSPTCSLVGSLGLSLNQCSEYCGALQSPPSAPQQGGLHAITARGVGSRRYTAKFLFRNCSQVKVTPPFWETCIQWLAHEGLEGLVPYLNLGGPPQPMRSP